MRSTISQHNPAVKAVVPFVRTLNIIKAGFVESTRSSDLGSGWFAEDAALASPTERVMKLQQRLLQDPDESFGLLVRCFDHGLSGAVWGMVMGGNMTGGGPGKWTVSSG